MKLAEGDMPFIVQVPRKPGQKEIRYTHLLNGMPDFETADFTENTDHSSSGLEARIEVLEQELAQLKSSFESLVKELKG